MSHGEKRLVRHAADMKSRRTLACSASEERRGLGQLLVRLVPSVYVDSGSMLRSLPRAIAWALDAEMDSKRRSIRICTVQPSIICSMAQSPVALLSFHGHLALFSGKSRAGGGRYY